MRPPQTHTLRSFSAILALFVLVLLAACGSSGGATPTATVRQTASPTAPAVPLAQLTVYATADGGTLRALQADTGQVRWQAQTGTTSGGKPVVDNGIVYVGSGSDGMVYAFNSRDGTPRWSAALEGSARGPLVVGGVVYGYSTTTDSAANQTIFIQALQGSDGTSRWRTQVGSAPVALPGLLGVSVVEGVVYVAVAAVDPSRPSGPLQCFLYAYRASDGSLLWRAQETHPTNAVVSGLTADASAVYLFVDRVYAYNRSDGTLLWSSQPSAQALGTDPLSLLVEQGIVYVNTLDGVSALQASTGNLLWQAPSTGSGIALADGVVYVSGKKAVAVIVALDGKTGRQLWQYTSAQRDAFLPLLVGGGLVYGATDQGIVALDALTGTVRWEAAAVSNGTLPVLVGTTLFVAAFEQTSTGYAALNTSDGTRLWFTPITEGMAFPSALTVGP